MTKLPQTFTRKFKHLLTSLFIVQICLLRLSAVLGQQEQLEGRLASETHVPSPIASASHISLDGLTLVIVFNRPVNLSASIESVEQRLASAEGQDDEPPATAPSPEPTSLRASESARLQLVPSGSSQADNRQTSRQAAASLAARSSDVKQSRQEGKQSARTQPAKVRYSSSSSLAAARRKTGRLRSSSGESVGRARAAFPQVAASGGEEEGPPAAVCQADEQENGLAYGQQTGAQLTPHSIGGVQLCAQLLTRKTLRLLHKFRIQNCLWPSQVQFLIQLGKPIKAPTSSSSSSAGKPPAGIKIAFRRGTLSGQGELGARFNEQDTGVELGKLPLEGLGVPLTPRLALTGPNQVPACGQFSLSAHLSSPYGTQPDESVKLQWSVERVGVIATGGEQPAAAAGPRPALNASFAGEALTAQSQQQSAESIEIRWRTLQQLVAANRANNLVLDAQLLQFLPQLYEFRLQVSFATRLTSFTLNATHQLGRLDFDAPIGTIYGTHLLGAEQQINTNQELALLADIQVPECAANIKQVGLYWQVSDPRVRFEQTYAPVYLAKANTLPEQALIEFRLNLFYGIRVKKFASAGAFVATGDSLLDAQISDGLLMASVGQPTQAASSGSEGKNDQSAATLANRQRAFLAATSDQQQDNQLELLAISRLAAPGEQPAEKQADKFTYQWSCFDGKTAQACQKSLKLQAWSGGTRYDIGTTGGGGQRQPLLLARPQPDPATGGNSNAFASSQTSSLLLIDRARQRQPILRLPLSWLEAESRLWFGLQRFDRHNPSQHSKTEYALVSVYAARGPLPPPTVTIGPVLVGRARQRATLRNPLTGAILLLEQTPAVIVGRLGAANASFAWRVPNYSQPLYWTSRQVENPLNKQLETVTELHLNAELLPAHAHYEVQLSVCSPDSSDAADAALASISLDVVQGVSQCRVEPLASPPAAALKLVSLATSGAGATAANKLEKEQQAASTQALASQEAAPPASNLPLVITVNHCNIPPALSPLTYQLYIVDTSAADGFIEASRPPASTSTSAPEPGDYTNEADELHFESLAQPLSVPQLSPVFSLSGLSGSALLGLLQTPPQQVDGESSSSNSNNQATSTLRARFGARICNRLQSCKMFYSASIDPVALLAGDLLASPLGTGSPAGAQNQSLALSLLAGDGPPPASSLPISERLQASGAGASQLQTQNKGHAIRALSGMLEGARRANVAGNSIAAISILNLLMALGQRLLEQAAAAAAVAVPSSSQQRERLAAKRGRQNYRQASGLPAAQDDTAGSDQSDQGAESNNGREPDASRPAHKSPLSDQQLEQLHDLLQAAMRDCLAYGAQSIQRQFHYTESGQTNVVLLATSRILSLQHDNLELRYRALRLISALVRKSMERAVDERALASLPDLKSIEKAFESLFATFGQHSIESLPAPANGLLADWRHTKRHNSATGERIGARNNSNDTVSKQSASRQGNTESNTESNSGSDDNKLDQLVAPAEAAPLVHSHNSLLQKQARLEAGSSSSSSSSSSSAAAAAAAAPRAGRAIELAPTSSALAAGLKLSASRRSKEEAILAYLRLVRQAHKALLQASAAQLALGAVQQLEYQSSGSPLPQLSSSSLAAPSISAQTISPPTSTTNEQQQQQAAIATTPSGGKFVWARMPAARIVSSLTHQTDLQSDTIDLDLHQFGSLSIRFNAQQEALRRLARSLSRSHVRCGNDSAAAADAQTTKCSSFVLVLTAFAGKAPFRSLDSLVGRTPTPLPLPAAAATAEAPLRVPVIQIDWLSPIDGSSLVELLRQEGATSALTDFGASLTFTLPPEDQQAPAGATNDNAKFKCYQFSEASNEWLEIEQPAPTTTPDGASGGERRLSCTFNGFGVVSAFQGSPPAVETSTELTIAMGVACCLALVAIFSLLGCIASNSKASRQRARQLRRRHSSDLNSASQTSSSCSYDQTSDHFDPASVRSRQTVR